MGQSYCGVGMNSQEEQKPWLQQTAAADGAYEAFIANAECKLTGVLPQTACIYVYALSAPGAHRPCAVYIGQSVRDAYTRLREHLRRGRTAAEAQLVSLLGAGNTMRILAMPAPEDALNTLESIGLRCGLARITAHLARGMKRAHRMYCARSASLAAQ